MATAMKRQLLLGAGRIRNKRMGVAGESEWGELTTLDVDDGTNPDIVWDLDKLPYPIAGNSFDECHAYEVLEKMTGDGDVRDLSVRRVDYADGSWTYASAWEPTPAELAVLNAGGSVVVEILGFQPAIKVSAAAAVDEVCLEPYKP